MWDWFARRYDAYIAEEEATLFGPWRQGLLSQVKGGSCLEVGAGTGSSAFMWPEGISRLVLLEPSAAMRGQIGEKIASGAAKGTPAYPVEPEILACGLSGPGSLPFANDSFDAVLSSLVLCGVPGTVAPIAEIHRVLKPGGTLYFMDHVTNDRWLPWLFSLLIAPLWKAVYCCSNIRDSHKNIEKVFDSVKYETHYPGFYMKFVYGTATK